SSLAMSSKRSARTSAIRRRRPARSLGETARHAGKAARARATAASASSTPAWGSSAMTSSVAGSTTFNNDSVPVATTTPPARLGFLAKWYAGQSLAARTRDVKPADSTLTERYCYKDLIEAQIGGGLL